VAQACKTPFSHLGLLCRFEAVFGHHEFLLVVPTVGIGVPANTNPDGGGDQQKFTVPKNSFKSI
jgi:hypothetical protein